MQVTGALSNQTIADTLEALLKRKRWITRPPGRTEHALRLRAGAIQDAVLDVLADADGALRCGEIHARVQHRLGRAVARDTVTSYLSVACRAADPKIVRRRGLG
jgi:hypothetical protein